MKIIRFFAAISLLAFRSPDADALSVLQIRDSLERQPVIYPESFETDVYKMQQNWYLQNYADIDHEADSRASVTPTDEEIIERLRNLSTVIEMPFNSVVRNNIIMYTERRKQLVENMLGMSLYYMPIFEQALDRYKLPLELKYLPVIESALNPEAVSRVGATGLWQFMLPTATGEGLEVSSLVDQRRDPYSSSDAAARYLKKLYDIFGDWSLAIAAYNCGPGNINKAMRRAGDGKKDFWQIYPYLPAETRGYFPAFIAANYVMTYYDKHNISPALARKPIVTDTVHVNKRVHFEQIRDVLGISLDELRTLNPQYRTDVIPGNIRPYALVLPSLQCYAYLAHEDSIVNHNAAKYSHRDVVEPAVSGNGSDAKGEYVEETIVKYHTVKKGETLASVAKRYGVTQAAIKSANKVGKTLRAGQRLRINTVQRRYLPKPEVKATMPEIAADTVKVTNDSIVAEADSSASTATKESARVAGAMNSSSEAQVRQTTKPKVTQPQAPTPKAKSQAPAQSQKSIQDTYVVKKGDNLSKIAAKYGVTVNGIRQANGLKGDALSIGQKLKIPAKSTNKSSKSRNR